jgi:hypothetical protein
MVKMAVACYPALTINPPLNGGFCLAWQGVYDEPTLLEQEEDMSTRESTKVNLDALIPRQDMASGKPQNIPRDFAFRHEELIYKTGWVYSVLRKPDFQRSTSFWTPEKVRDMVVSFIEGETVPGVIVWRSPQSDLYVIDGAHRLSSIIAWVNDDYGDGKISKDHYGEPRNVAAATKARELVNDAVGSYDDLKDARNNEAADTKHKANAKKLNFARLPIQELEKVSDAPAAEKAFLKINEQGVALSETEKWLITARFCPNSIAARAISLKGLGGAYWSRFSDVKTRNKISELGASVYNLLFTPDLDIGELKTADLPIAGAYTASNALNLIFQFVNFANDVPAKPPATRAEAEKLIPIDVDGLRTIEFLQKAKTAAALLSNLRKTNYAHSADLHPFVYFYSKQGNHQPNMFLAASYWLHGLDKAKKISDLANNGLRGRLENFLLKNAFLIESLSRKVRGEERAVRQLKKYLDFLFDSLSQGIPEDELLGRVGDKFNVSTQPDPEDDGPSAPGSRIPIRVKNALFIEHELASAKKCELCTAIIPARGLSTDHRLDRIQGGAGTKGNAGPTHHACNTAKNKIKKLNAKAI